MFINRSKKILSYWGVATYGGGKAPTVQTIADTPAPPPPTEGATMEEFKDVTAEADKKQAITQGAKSLQIPLGTIGTGTLGS